MANSAYWGTSIIEMMVHPTKNDATMVTTMGRLCRYSMWKTGSCARRSTLPKAAMQASAAAKVTHTSGRRSVPAGSAKSSPLMPRSSSSTQATSRADPSQSKRAGSSSG